MTRGEICVYVLTGEIIPQVDICREAYHLFQLGEQWQDVAFELSPLLLRHFPSIHKHLCECKGLAKKQEYLSIWLNRVFNQYWYSVFIFGGPQVREWLLLSLERKLTPEQRAGLPFRLTPQIWNGNRGDNLLKAIQIDRANDKWNVLKGTGPEFRKFVKRHSK